VQQHQRRIGQLHPGRLEQRPRLIEGEPQVGGADLGQLCLQPQPMQPQPQVPAGGEHEPQLRRRAQHQQLKLALRLVRAQLVQVVDHQPDPVLQRPQVLQQPLDNCPAVKVGRRGQPPHRLGSGGCSTERAGHRDPEPARIALLAMHRYPGGALG
jgi:hypothetical protein